MSTDEIRDFLATTPVFGDVPLEQLADIATLFRVEHYPSGAFIIREGGYSPAVYFLRSGRAAVKVARGERREIVAHLQPPDIIGELSFITGKVCNADVEVEMDAEVLALPKDSVDKLPERRDAILRGLLRVTAERLQKTVAKGAREIEMPTVLLLPGPNFEAPREFAEALAASIARQTERQTLLVRLEPRGDRVVRRIGDTVSRCSYPAETANPETRAALTRDATNWKREYDILVFDPAGLPPEAAEQLAGFANHRGHLLGPGDPIPPSAEGGRRQFIAQSAARPGLDVLDGSRQLIYDAAAAAKGEPSARFQRTVDSLARFCAQIQVGLALGGGAAWGWSHIGVLSVLEKAGLPVDLLTGCSMGSVIGAFRATGTSIEEMTGIAEYWRTRTRRFIEWRVWRMSLVNERMAIRTFGKYFDARGVNGTELPFWANAVDIRTGKEFAIRDGSLVDCIRASIALPGLLAPMARGASLLVDAGIMDPVPVKLVRRMGAHYTVGVNAMAPVDASPVQTSYPFNAIDVMTRCMFVMGHEIGQQNAAQAANIVLAPSMTGISMLQFGRSPEIIERGLRAAEENLPEILAGYQRLKGQLYGKPEPPRPRI